MKASLTALLKILSRAYPGQSIKSDHLRNGDFTRVRLAIDYGTNRGYCYLCLDNGNIYYATNRWEYMLRQAILKIAENQKKNHDEVSTMTSSNDEDFIYAP
jgi:hypothetical protein